MKRKILAIGFVISLVFSYCLSGLQQPPAQAEESTTTDYDQQIRQAEEEKKKAESRLESLEACRDILYRYGVADRLPLSCPLKDKFRISSPYGGRIHPITGKHSFHSGVDMAVELAAPVHATASGTVVFAGRKGGYGRCVIIRHSYGFETLYAHLAAYYTTEGKKLGKGAVIGFAGSTGRSTGYHLHYEIRKNGRTIKPYWYGYDNSGRD